MSQVSETLFRSRSRTAVLKLLFCRRLSASVSELARRSGLTPRSVAAEVRNLAGIGLVRVESVGGADLVRGNLDHPARPFIEGLLTLPAQPSASAQPKKLRESLIAWGAPLAGEKAHDPLPFDETLLGGLEAARRDGTILRVLPVVLASNLDHVDWTELREGARRRKLKAELGMLVELTADLLGRASLKKHVADLRDHRRRVPRFLPEVRSKFERQLASQRTPSSAQRWGFLMNLTEDSFRSTMEKHGARVPQVQPD